MNQLVTITLSFFKDVIFNGAMHVQMPAMPQDPRAQMLAQMHDVIEPEAVSWWPPAPGWIVLGILLVVLIGFGAYQCVNQYKKRRYRKAALKTLTAIRHSLHHTKTINAQDAVRECIQLLKRTFFTAYPGSRRYIAGLDGQAWIELLQATSSTPIPEQNLVIEIERALYHPNQNAIDNETLFIFCEKWIKQHLTHSEKIQTLIVNAATEHLAYEPEANPRGLHV